MSPRGGGFEDHNATAPSFIDQGFGLLRLGSGYRNFEEMFKSAALINPILYNDGNMYQAGAYPSWIGYGKVNLVFEVFDPRSGEELLKISSPAPFYVFTNAGRDGERFEALRTLLFRYAKTFGIERDAPYFWGLFASDVWCGAVPQNFKLDGADTISFGGYDRPVKISGMISDILNPKEHVSIKARQKAEEEALSKTTKDYISQCAAYVNYKPLLIRVSTEAGKLVFWYDINKSPYQYKLVYCMFNFSKIVNESLSPMRILELYEADKNYGIDDLYICKVDNTEYLYWKDIENKYLLVFNPNGTIEVCPIVDEETLGPLTFETKMITQEMLEAEFNEEKHTTTETRFVPYNGGVIQEFVKRPVTFEDFLRNRIGKKYWAMGFRKFGKSIQLNMYQDDEQAFQWFKKSAEQNNARAQNALGVMYLKGEGVDIDYNKAKEWFTKAVANSPERSIMKINLGYTYELQGDISKAHEWYNEAVSQITDEEILMLRSMVSQGNTRSPKSFLKYFDEFHHKR